MNSRRWLDGRALLLALAAGFGAYMAWLPKPDRLAEWHTLGVPPLNLSFGDLRVVTAGWDCWRRGIDVLVANPCDPWARPMNYPRLWLLPSALGLGQSSTVVLGIAFGFVFLAAMMVLVGRLGLLDTIIYGVSLGSPAVLLTIERGNNDLVVFTLCVVGLLALQRASRAWTSVGVALILVATMLKLYPVFALAALVPRTRLAIAALAVAAVYALLTLPDLLLISQGTPRPALFAYGIAPVAAAFGVAQGLVGLGIVAGALFVSTLQAVRQTAETSAPSLKCDAFMIGSAMFLGTFLIGSNWVYRLLLLLLTMPQLLEWTRIPSTRSLAVHVLAGVLALLWLSPFTLKVGLGTDVFQILSVALSVALGGIMTAILWERTVMILPRLSSKRRGATRPSLG